MADRRPEREAHDVHLPNLERPEVHHEASDINVWAVGKFAIVLAIVCVAALGLLVGLFRYFENLEGGPLPNQNLNIDARRLPPEPRLQQSPITDLNEMRSAEDRILNGYGWVDQGHGIVRVPIGRAIDMLARRGLPSRPQNEPQSASAGVSVPTESGLGPKMIQDGGPLAGALK